MSEVPLQGHEGALEPDVRALGVCAREDLGGCLSVRRGTHSQLTFIAP